MRRKRPEPRPDTYWKPWLAWYPVKLENTGEWVWFEYVWRHVTWHCAADYACCSKRHRDDVYWGSANIERNGPEWATTK